MKNLKNLLIFLLIILISSACTPSKNTNSEETASANSVLTETIGDEVVVEETSSAINNSNEPVFISGTIPFTSPFFLNYASEPFVMLEDQAGFYKRDKEFEFALEGQSIGPVWLIDDNTLGFNLSLPAVPQATLIDVDNNGQEDSGVMVFAVAMWSNIWGDPFLEKREGTGWSGGHSTTVIDIENDAEIISGHLIIWAPDDNQQFPSGFGEDGLLLTEDDPVVSVPAGYSIVDINQEEFIIYKEARPEFELVEGPGELNNFSDLNYIEAFDNMFEKISVEYPFTSEKNIDWDALYSKYSTRIENAKNDTDFYRVLKDFSFEFSDKHVGLTFNSDVFVEQAGGSFGMNLTELSDGTVVVTQIFPGYPAALNGIKSGAIIFQWDGKPVDEALAEVNPFTGPFSTAHHKRIEQVNFLTRYPIDTSVEVVFQNPGENKNTVELTTEFEVQSFLATIPYLNFDPIVLPIEAETITNGYSYIRIQTFSGDMALMTRIWEHYLESAIENSSPGIIIDVRANSGGSGHLAANFAAFFFDEEFEIGRHGYYNSNLGEFEFDDEPVTIDPAPIYYDGPVVVLVDENCVSACEGFAYYLTINNRATVIGHTPTAGAFGEVGQGQFSLPGEIDMQFPTGRPETSDGELLIEGTGIIPDIFVPITFESASGQIDTVLFAAIEFLQQ